MTLPEQRQLNSFLPGEKDNIRYPLTLWFDSAKEGKDFGRLLELKNNFFQSRNLDVRTILDKSLKHVKHKTRYREGIYWPLVDIEKMLTLRKKVKAPFSITKMSAWQHQDFTIADRYDPMFTVEVTEHALTYNNIAQRIPRLVLPVSCGIPSAILQRVDAGSKEKYKGWFLKALCKSTEIFGKPCIALLFDDKTRSKSEELLSCMACQLIDYICFNNRESLKTFEELLLHVSEENQRLAKQWYDHNALLACRWLDANSSQVRVIIRVKPEDSMWKTKGTGGLDPYPGLVLLADLLLCRTGPNKSDRDRKLVVDFRHIEEDFWWFERYPEELYLQLLIDEEKRIADEVVFKKS